MTDLEGVSCFGNAEDLNAAATVQRLMEDVGAAVDGVLAAGAERVYVYDGHGGGENFIPGLLHPKAVQVKEDWQDYIKQRRVGAYLEIGAHAMAGTVRAFLDHTQSSAVWHDYKINGVRHGEIAQGAFFVGAYDIPFVMVSGDTAACREAESLIDGIRTAPVKTGISNRRAECKDSASSLALIRQTAMDALRHAPQIKPVRPSLPAVLELTFHKTDQCDDYFSSHSSRCIRTDARTVSKTVTGISDYRDLLF